MTLNDQLRQTLHTPPVSPSPALKALAAEALRQRRGRNSFPRFLLGQIRFTLWRIWAVQGALLAFFVLLLSYLYGRYFWESPSSMVRLLFCVSVLVSGMAVPMVVRSIRYRMQEIEGVCYFSASHLLAAKLLIIGIGDLFLLSGLFLSTVWSSTLGIGSTALYLALPFLIFGSASVYMLGHWNVRQYVWGSTTLCIALLFSALFFPADYFQYNLTPGWAAVCGGLLLFCAGQFYHILHRDSYAQMQVN